MTMIDLGMLRMLGSILQPLFAIYLNSELM